jgi:hypothetical protein
MPDRTGSVGACFEYDARGRRLAGSDQLTWDALLDYSRSWPDTFHVYIGTSGWTGWCQNGVEIPAPTFPEEHSHGIGSRYHGDA